MRMKIEMEMEIRTQLEARATSERWPTSSIIK